VPSGAFIRLSPVSWVRIHILLGETFRLTGNTPLVLACFALGGAVWVDRRGDISDHPVSPSRDVV